MKLTTIISAFLLVGLLSGCDNINEDANLNTNVEFDKFCKIIPLLPNCKGGKK